MKKEDFLRAVVLLESEQQVGIVFPSFMLRDESFSYVVSQLPSDWYTVDHERRTIEGHFSGKLHFITIRPKGMDLVALHGYRFDTLFTYGDSFDMNYLKSRAERVI